ncbi:MAG: hypothetical protein RL721_1452 [Candidatus Eisenbacteria bacterium]|jgi:hypothetical protein
MKRVLAVLAATSLLVAAVAFARSGDQHDHSDHSGHNHGPKTSTTKASSWTGEILDAGCFLGHNAQGPKHTSCALKCIANGMPMMLLLKDGSAVLLTPPHEGTEGYEQAKDMAGKKVTITGKLQERGGVKGIEVATVAIAK